MNLLKPETHQEKENDAKTPDQIGGADPQPSGGAVDARRSAVRPGGDLASATPIPQWKRGLDVTLVLLSSPFWWPVYMAIGIWVKIVSTGPRLFRQERVGCGGGRFTIYKFRSMKVNAETRTHEAYVAKLMQTDSPMSKMDEFGDPRIIPGGCFLRATGLDELPQIFNVLRGDMSLVGPRPCTPKEYGHYRGGQKERFEALPGLTGYWQVNGKNKTTFSEMVDMDIKYVRSQSLVMDLSIMLKTFPTLLSQVFEVRRKAKEARVAKGLPKSRTTAIATTIASKTTTIATKLSTNTTKIATKITNNTTKIATREGGI